MALLFEPINASIATSGIHDAPSAVITVPVGQYWKPSTLYSQWVTLITAGNRLPKFTITDALSNTVCEIVTTINLPINLSATYNVITGAPTTGTFLSPTAGTRYTVCGLPFLTMGPGWTVTTSDTAAIDPTNDTVVMLLSYTLLSATIV